ncbi:MAG: hypothetical protein EB060_02785 [Proteobacteria bacterium]|nr:hypothetical protein [Pseudomonadota bacterium]
MRIRLLPVLILACIGLFAVKIDAIYEHRQDFMGVLFVPNSQAAEDTKKAAPAAEKPAAAGAGEKKSGEKAASGEHTPAAEAAATGGSGSSGAAAEAPPPTVIKPPETYSDTEVEILKRLSERRKKLDEWERDLEVKRNALQLTELRIEQKLSELNTLKVAVEKLLAQYNEKEDAKIRSLVKIYENMKPKDAARIFDELDMDVLLQVVDKMKEAKSAPVLANMSPARAKEITQYFARQRKLPDAPIEPPPPAAAPKPYVPGATPVTQ